MLLKEEGAAQVKAAVDKMGRSFTDATKKSSLLDNAFSDLKSTMAGFATVAALGALFSKIATETADAEFASAQLNAALKSTAGAAGQSVDALNAQAKALSQLSVFDDDAITSAQALLLTFTKIGGQTFPQATQAVLNVAQALNTDLKSAAIQVGKALNDPIQGISALSRSGIQFTEAQKIMITQLVESNRLMDAQAIILGELETQFGKSAEAARNTFGGSLKVLANDIGNALTLTGDGVSIATKSVQYLSTVVRGLRTFFDQVMLLGEMAYVNVSGIFRIMKAMESPGTYVEAYRKITNEMEASREKFRAAYKDAGDVSAMSKEAASFITKMGSSTAATAGAFGMFSAELFKAQGAYKSFAVTATKPKTSGKAPVMTQVSDIGTPYMQRQAFPMMAQTFDLAPVLRVPPEATANNRSTLAQYGADVLLEWGAMIDNLADQMSTTLADSIGSAFEAAFATGRISEGFRALGQSMLAGLGSMLQMFGTKALVASQLMASLLESFKTLNPKVAVAAAIGLIALGGALKGAAQSAFGGGGAGGNVSMASVGSFGGGGGGTTRLPGVTFGPTASATAGSLTAAAPVNVTIIGPNDPSAQRQMQELIANAQRRGNV